MSTFTFLFLSPIYLQHSSSSSFRCRDFDASLYLCEEAFGPLPLDTVERLAGTLLLPPYIFTLLLLSGTLAAAVLHNLRYVMGALQLVGH